MTTNGIQVKLFPQLVEYRMSAGRFIRVVRVYCATPDPRVVGYVEEPGQAPQPMAMFWSELEDFISDAKTRLQEGGG